MSQDNKNIINDQVQYDNVDQEAFNKALAIELSERADLKDTITYEMAHLWRIKPIVDFYCKHNLIGKTEYHLKRRRYKGIHSYSVHSTNYKRGYRYRFDTINYQELASIVMDNYERACQCRNIKHPYEVFKDDNYNSYDKLVGYFYYRKKGGALKIYTRIVFIANYHDNDNDDLDNNWKYKKDFLNHFNGYKRAYLKAWKNINGQELEYACEDEE